ncbi:MAG: hypothetical protein ACD_42C00018G0002 [uncultured bacterium]|nr:MAG: hypothetical protein ACD_42C00018G0002 [uncultured bacterium]
MDKYSKLLIVLTVVTMALVVVGDAVYAKYRTSGHRYISTVRAAQLA